MKIPRRASRIALLLGLFLFLGVLFPSFIVDNFVTPVALVLWLFWRILRSVDQGIYWSLLIFSVLGYAFVRLFRLAQDPAILEQTLPSDSNAALEQINSWRISIRLTSDETEKFNSLKRKLGQMLVTMYASKQPETAPFEIYAALQRHQIPLPEHIDAFLYPAEPSGARRSLKQVLHTIRDAPRKRVRRWTGRDVAEYYQSIEDVISFMESSLELKHGDEHFDTHHH
jgi:hypothetical protein